MVYGAKCISLNGTIVYFLLGISPAPGKYPEENIQYSNHGESLKSRINGTTVTIHSRATRHS